MSVDLDKLKLTKSLAIILQSVCLFLQVLTAVIFIALGLSTELLLVVVLAWVSQSMLITAITPRRATWNRVYRNHRASAAMLHKALDSTEVLIITSARISGKAVSLEEFCWEANLRLSLADRARSVLAAMAFMVSAFAIVLISWMSQRSKVLYLIIGVIGLLANTVDAIMQPNWQQCLKKAFKGVPRAARHRSSLLAAVGILIAVDFRAAKSAARCLYPDNKRFDDTLQRLEDGLNRLMCGPCRELIRKCIDHQHSGHLCSAEEQQRLSCMVRLALEAENCDSKQLADAYAAVFHVLTYAVKGFYQSLDSTILPANMFQHDYW